MPFGWLERLAQGKNIMLLEKALRTQHPQSTAQIAGHPLHPMLIPFPVAFLVATFVCDSMPRRKLPL